MSGLVEWVIFLALAVTAVLMAGGMLLTMSMYRAGLALMSSFVALAGLFILLDADLLATIQVMMNVGGMLVMILFMVMQMTDPGGEMMWDMKRTMRLPGPGAFSMSMPRGAPPGPPPAPGDGKAETATAGDWTCPMHPEMSAPGPGDCPICGMPLVPRAELAGAAGPAEPAAAPGQTYTCPMHPEVRQDHLGQCPICGMDLVPAAETEPPAAHQPATATTGHGSPRPGVGGHDGRDGHAAHGGMAGMSMAGMSPRQHYQMMVDMAMSTAQLPWALAVGAASALVLVLLVVRTAWPLAAAGPTQDAAVAVGELLLSRYMIGFEGAAFLILAGMVAAVIFAKREPGQALSVVAGQSPAGAQVAGTAVYTCPMHPEVRQDHPGQCPICGMDLVPAADTMAAPVGHEDHDHGGHA